MARTIKITIIFFFGFVKNGWNTARWEHMLSRSVVFCNLVNLELFVCMLRNRRWIIISSGQATQTFFLCRITSRSGEGPPATRVYTVKEHPVLYEATILPKWEKNSSQRWRDYYHLMELITVHFENSNPNLYVLC